MDIQTGYFMKWIKDRQTKYFMEWPYGGKHGKDTLWTGLTEGKTNWRLYGLVYGWTDRLETCTLWTGPCTDGLNINFDGLAHKWNTPPSCDHFRALSKIQSWPVGPDILTMK